MLQDVLENELAAMRAAAAMRETQVIETIRQMDEMLREVEAQRNEAHRSHEAARAARDFVQRVLDTMHEVLLVLGPDGRVTSVNRRFRDLVGYTDAEIVGQYPETALSPDDVARLTAEKGDHFSTVASPLFVLTGTHKQYETEVELVSKDGNRLPHQLRGTVLYGPSGKKEGAVLIGSDIRALKELTRYLQDEMKVAVRIQSAILPDVPEHPELQIAAAMQPTAEVAGDYYDVLIDQGENLWFGIGDVTGHGVTPGLIMMMTQSAFATAVSQADLGPRDAFLAINRLLCQNVRHRMKQDEYITLTVLKYEGQGAFAHAGAHIDHIVHRHATGTCERIPTEGVYAGILPDIADAVAESRFALAVGDVLVLHTDGIVEAPGTDGGLFGFEGLEAVVAAHAGESAGAIRDAIMAATMAWCHHQPDDDISLVVIKRQA
jgi:PAS domain S-box-containing protein